MACGLPPAWSTFKRNLVVDVARLTRVDATTWQIEPHGAMRVPAIIYADEDLIRDIDDKVYEQAANVATLPGIVGASYAMPDAHWGYGFPIGGVAAFDPDEGGIISAGGVWLRHLLRRSLHADRAFSCRNTSRADVARQLPISANPRWFRQHGRHNPRCS